MSVLGANCQHVDNATGVASVEKPPCSLLPISFTKELTGTFNGRSIRYRAVAGETYIRDERAVPVASFFSTSYLRTDVENSSDRPVMFIFNGGPGSSAQWLHLGAFGPVRVDLPSEPENVGAAPYSLVDNISSTLDACDLVFVDPIGTGYSCALGDKNPKDFWGALEDARSVADFIQTWITDQQRWNSPKYIVGESYGTTRACLVAELLSQRFIALNGIVWIAGVSDYQYIRPRLGDGAILPYVSFLPTYAATAWYHGRVSCNGRTLASFLEEVRAFSCTEYAHALIANHRLSITDRKRTVSKIASYSGLSEAYVEQSNLRIHVTRFFKELLRESGVVIGRLDGRYTGVELDCAGESAESDPTLDAIGSALTTAMNTHLSDLGVRMPRPYVSMTKNILDSWNWQLEDKVPNGGGYVNVMPHLGRAMRHNKDLRLMAACGYYDLAAPFFGIENGLSEDGLVHERISFRYYETGHMIFLHPPSRDRFLSDIRQFMAHGIRSTSLSTANE